MEEQGNFPYDRPFFRVFLHGDLTFLLVAILIGACGTAFVVHRFTSRGPRRQFCTITDVILLLFLLGLPITYLGTGLAVAVDVLARGGIDSDWPLPILLQEAQLLSALSLYSMLAAATSLAVQWILTRSRKETAEPGPLMPIADDQTNRSKLGTILSLFAGLLLAISLADFAPFTAQIAVWCFIIIATLLLIWFTWRKGGIRNRVLTTILALLAFALTAFNLISCMRHL